MGCVESSNEPPPVVVQPEAAAPPDVQWQESCQVQGQPQNIRQWSTELFGCFCEKPSKRCCYSYWCYPCFVCSLTKRMGENRLGHFLIGFPFTTAMRSRLRGQYGIQGTVLDDCCMSLWCSSCTLTQMDRELEHIEPYDGSYVCDWCLP